MASQDFSFSVGNPSSDALIQKQYPAVELNGTETPLGAYTETREVNGAVWRVINATWNNATNAGFQQIDPTKASSALIFNPTGVLQSATAAAGAASPIAWSIATIGGFPLPIPIADGGTGLAAVGPNGYVLESNGTGLFFAAIPTSATSPFFNVMSAPFNATGLGYPNDDYPAVQAAINAAAAAGAGQVYFPVPPVAYYLSQALTVPYVLGDVYGVTPYQPPIRLFGVGPARNGINTLVPGAKLIQQGSVIDCRASTGVASFVDTRGNGFLEIDHLTIMNGGTANVPFIQFTNTNVYYHHLGFIGNKNNFGTTCLQDAVIWGGAGYFFSASITASGSTVTSTTPIFTAAMAASHGYTIAIPGAGVAGATLISAITGFNSATSVTIAGSATATVNNVASTLGGFFTADPNGLFQGYGSHGHDNIYSRIRHIAIFNSGCNGPVLGPNEGTCDDCGCSDSDAAPIIINANITGTSGSSQGYVLGGIYEVTNYTYIVSCRADATNWVFINMGGYDNPTLAGQVYFADTSSSNNAVYGGIGGAGTPPLAGPGAGSNRSDYSGVSQKSQVPGGITLGNNGVLQSVQLLVAPGITASSALILTATGGNPIEMKGSTGQPGIVNVYDSTGTTIVTQLNGSQKGVIRIPGGATGARPNGPASGAGAQWYDTTLGIPIWWNGSNWTNAAGTTV